MGLISTFKYNEKRLYREFQSPFLSAENQLTLDCNVMDYDLQFGGKFSKKSKMIAESVRFYLILFTRIWEL